MPYRDWIKHPALGVALFALLTLTPLALSKEYQVVRHTEYQAPTKHLASSDSEHFPRKSPLRDPNPNREEWRQEKDLEAQSLMAIWAGLMLLITSAGVWYVAQTLGATREALDQTQRANDILETAMRVENRPWLGLEKIEVFEVHPVGGIPVIIRFKYWIKNYGKTPAVGAQIGNDGWYQLNDPPGGIEPIVFKQFCEQTTRYGTVILPGESFQQTDFIEVLGSNDEAMPETFIYAHYVGVEPDKPFRLKQRVVFTSDTDLGAGYSAIGLSRVASGEIHIRAKILQGELI